MRSLSLTFAMLLVIWFAPAPSAGQYRSPRTCKERADERLQPSSYFHYYPHLDQTLLTLSLRSASCEKTTNLTVSYYFAGREMKVAPGEVTLGFRVFCPAAEGAPRCYRASLLVDGETVIPLGELQLSLGSFIDNAEGWLKGTYAVVPVKTFARLGVARKVEIRVGRNRFELPERHVVALRETALKLSSAI